MMMTNSELIKAEVQKWANGDQRSPRERKYMKPICLHVIEHEAKQLTFVALSEAVREIAGNPKALRLAFTLDSRTDEQEE